MAKPLPPNELLRVTMVFDRLPPEQQADLLVELNKRYSVRMEPKTKPAIGRIKNADSRDS